MNAYQLMLCQTEVDAIVEALMQNPNKVIEDNIGGTMTLKELAEMLQEMTPYTVPKPVTNGLCI